MIHEQEDTSANDYFQLLTQDVEVVIQGDAWELWEITDRINVELMREAFQASVTDDTSAVRKLYIKTIQGLML